jgi:hypothetical protein
MVDIITTIAGPLISGLVALYVCTVQNDKLVTLIQYRLEQLEKKVDQHNKLNDKYIKLEAEVEILKGMMKG